MRSFGDLTPDEQSLFRIHRRRVENDLCTPQEKKESQAFMDGMLHKGPTGPVMSKLGEFEQRLEAVEITKGNRKFPVTAKDLRALRDELDELKATIGQLQNEEAASESLIVKLSKEVEQMKENVAAFGVDLNKHSEGLKVIALNVQGVTKTAGDVNEKIEKEIKARQAGETKLLKALGDREDVGEDVKAYLFDECRTAIMAEADAAAKIAVDNYMKGTEF
jgi:chromosome segregation ATPase